MKVTILEGEKGNVLRFRKRDIVVTSIEEEGSPVQYQAFYLSTGENSGKPGEWLPFSGIALVRNYLAYMEYFENEGDPRVRVREGEQGEWFAKTRFSNQRVERHLERYGTEKLKTASEQLKTMDISPGQEAGILDVNKHIVQAIGRCNPNSLAYGDAAGLVRAYEFVKEYEARGQAPPIPKHVQEQVDDRRRRAAEKLIAAPLVEAPPMSRGPGLKKCDVDPRMTR